jgi:pimeloyl-ACP methyl ester carboxylesterase
VIAPDGPPHGPAFNEWLAVFLDSLGIQDLSIVAIGNFAGLAREFAAVEPDRVRRVFSIGDGESPLAVADALRSIASLTDANAPLDH